jgi:hypothetical protein
MKRWQAIAKLIVTFVAILVTVSWGEAGNAAHAAFWGRSQATATKQATVKKAGKIAEASPPIVLQELRQALDDYQPQVTIISPRKNDVLTDTTVSVRFLVNDLPLFKNETFGLGPHLHVLLDNRPYQAVYDTSQPLVFDKLEPGTHTIRAFASRPWHESFKNEGAFAQTTFHVLTKTQDNNPDSDLPLLTYSRPQGTYGAEPILLDFYLTNAPLHLVAQADTTDDIADWRIRCTVNGDSFVIDRWQPLYLQGFKPGKNWVQLEYLDDKGNPVQNVFNNTVRLVEYQPNGDDTLSKLVRGELAAADVRGIVDPDYVPPAPEPTPEPSPEPTLEPTSKPTPEPTIDPTDQPPSTLATPQAEPSPDLEATDRPSPIILPEPSPTLSPAPPSEPFTPEPAPSVPEVVLPPESEAPEAERVQPETPIVVEPKLSHPTVKPASPSESISTNNKTPSGQERLRQLGQQFGRYLPQKRRAIAPSSSARPTAESDRSKVMSGDETSPMPNIAIPDPLPPTLPEIIDTAPLEAPTSGAPASAVIEKLEDRGT